MYLLKVEDPNKLFFTSDTHFGHFNICRYCHRPFQSRSEMDQTLIANWNSVVPEDGIVVHCGDFMLPHDLNIKEYMKYMSKLNGRILLLRGNHDIIELLTSNEKLISVQDKAMIEVDSIKIYAEHYPCAAFNGDYHVYGHVHTLSDGICYGMDAAALAAMKKVTYDVGVDQNGYKPISYWQLCDIIRQQLHQGVPAKKG